MKILLVNYNDLSGGSAKSVYRLHKQLLADGVDSKMLVSLKQRQDKEITGAKSWPANILRRARLVGDKLPLLKFPKRQYVGFSTQRLPNRLDRKINSMRPDIVNLNWVGHGMLTVEAVSKISPPLVWTLHDVWPFTGGCHVNLACQGFQYSCGKCPQLGSDKGDDLSNQLWRQKEKMWRKLKLTLVAPSRWMAGVANNSSLLHNAKIEIIPHGLDTQIFHPWDKQKARHDLGVPLEKRLLLFGAASRGRHKGFSLLKEALQGLRPEMKNSLELLMFGPDQAVDLSGLDLPIHSFGSITDEKKLAQLYSAADLTVVPSLQESFGLVAVESLACATPVAAFAKTGLLDIVDHQKDGCLAEPFEAADLSSGIQWILEDDIRRDQLGENARNKVMKEYDIKLQAERYRALYSDLLQ